MVLRVVKGSQKCTYKPQPPTTRTFPSPVSVAVRGSGISTLDICMQGDDSAEDEPIDME